MCPHPLVLLLPGKPNLKSPTTDAKPALPATTTPSIFAFPRETHSHQPTSLFTRPTALFSRLSFETMMASAIFGTSLVDFRALAKSARLSHWSRILVTSIFAPASMSASAQSVLLPIKAERSGVTPC